MIRRRDCATAALLVGLALSGCERTRSVPAETALQHNRCQGLEPGLTQIDYSRLARIRGSTLLDLNAPQGKEAPADTASGDDLLLVAVSRGEQPTAGYALRLDGVTRRGTAALIEVIWQTPEPDSLQAQVTTHPCLVVALPADQLKKVQARDQAGEDLGIVSLSPPAP